MAHSGHRFPKLCHMISSCSQGPEAGDTKNMLEEESENRVLTGPGSTLTGRQRRERGRRMGLRWAWGQMALRSETEPAEKLEKLRGKKTARNTEIYI